MTTHTLDRTSTTRALPLAATIFVACALLGNSLSGELAPDMGDKAGWTTAATGILLEVGGFAALLAFVAWAATNLRGAWSPAALAAGTTALAVKLSSGAPAFAAIHEDLDPDVADALIAVNDWSFVLFWLPLGLFVVTIALGAKNLGLLRAPGSAVGTVLGGLTAAQSLLVIAVPGALVPIPFLLSLVWLAVTGVVVARRSSS